MKRFWKNTTAKILTIATTFGAIGVIIGSYSSIENKAIEVVNNKEKENKYYGYTLNKIDSVFNCSNEISLLKEDIRDIRDTLTELRLEAYSKESKVNERITVLITMFNSVNTRIEDLIDRINNQKK